MNYNPGIHHRRSIRLKGYDYSQPGLYFVTICTQDRLPLFGKIKNRQMVLNDAGIMVKNWWNELSNKYPNIELHRHITMPNHFHGIIQIVGADLCVCPDDERDGPILQGEHAGSPLQAMVQWFKTMTTNQYICNVKRFGWGPFKGKLWQRNYYEHIIRDEKSYNLLSEYIVNNPRNWKADTYYCQA